MFSSMRRRPPWASTGAAPASSSVVVLCGGLLPILTTPGLVELPYPIGQKLCSHGGAMTSYRLEVSAFQVIVSTEEALDRVQALWRQLCQGLDGRSVDRRHDSAQEAVITEGLPVFRLLGLDHAHQAYGDQTARPEGFLPQHED